MCDRCVKLDSKIARYSALLHGTFDRQAQTALNDLIDDCKVEKRALHPDQADDK
jgi:hypothetical protein